MLPTKLTQDLQAAGTDQWVLLSTYKLVTGSKLSGGRRWDCTAADPRKHWTTELESYCLVDIQTALASIRPGSVITDPAGVAEAGAGSGAGRHAAADHDDDVNHHDHDEPVVDHDHDDHDDDDDHDDYAVQHHDGRPWQRPRLRP